MNNKNYCASTLKRFRRTNKQIEQLDNQIISVLKEDYPQSVRHIFYRMTDPRLSEPVEKSDRGYRHVQERCVKLRRAGCISYDWIVDMSRRGYFVNTFSDVSDFISRMAGLYRADLWELSEYHCEVWCESRRVGINKSQIVEYRLPTKLRKESDVRSQQVAAKVAEQSERDGLMILSDHARGLNYE